MSLKRLRRIHVAFAAALVSFALASAQGTVYLLNGSFSQCVQPCDSFGSPSSWATGELQPTTGCFRDMGVYNSAPASLCMIATGAGDGGNVNQGFMDKLVPAVSGGLPAAPGATFTWEAQVRIDSSQGGSFQLVAHYSSGVYWTNFTNNWVTLYQGAGGALAWTHVNGTSTVPSAATWGLLRIWVSGAITFHVDDIKINGQNEVVSVERFVPDNSSRVKSQSLLASGGNLVVYRPDGRQVMRVGSSNRLDTRQLTPGCYLVARRSSDGVLAQQMLAR